MLMLCEHYELLGVVVSMIMSQWRSRQVVEGVMCVVRGTEMSGTKYN